MKNQQGDITGLMLPNGGIVVTYEYDAWGNIIEHTALNQLFQVAYKMNSYTYRGYQYDQTTGFYYLQSRYYDPEVGRFLNADDTSYLGVSGTTLGYNLYAYCENNGVVFVDPTGNGLASVIVREANYIYNSKLKFGRYIYTQRSGNAAKARMGLKPGSYNGCGWIATYNANTILGISEHPSKIIRYYDTYGTLASGLLGITSFSIVTYYRLKGLKVTERYHVKYKNSLDSMIKEHRVAIVCYGMIGGAMHYVAVRWLAKNKRFEVYNYKSQNKSDVYVSFLNAVIRDAAHSFVAFIGIK